MHQSNQHEPRIQLFRSAWLERFTVISIGAFVVTWALFLPIVVVTGLVSAPTLWAPALVVLGVVAWTLVEYLLHRFPFHCKARSALLKRAVFIIHGNHHADTNDPLRNLMPPIVSLPLGALIWAACVWVFGLAGTWLFLGFILGYVAYDLIHYACHQFPMKGRLAHALKAHHMRHHHLEAGGNYAVTAIVWDRIFATRISTAQDRA